jgi:hypothetical protein
MHRFTYFCSCLFMNRSQCEPNDTLRMKNLFCLGLIILGTLSGKAQLNVADEPVKMWFMMPHIGWQIPGGDMKERFHDNAMVGFAIHHKTASQWLFGLEWSYLFAEKVRNEDEILKNITTSEGGVIDQTGVFANLHFRQRGFYANARFGRLFPTKFGNPNSGVVVWTALGLLQHKIRIEVQENTAPQLKDDYVKGYDKLSNGPAGSLYLGYMHVSNNKFVNFSFGAEYMYASTKSRRDYDFVLMGKDNTIRNDHLLTLRFNWIIPFYSRANQVFYY